MKKKISNIVLGTLLGTLLFGMTAFAAEFTVTPINSIGTTTDGADLLADADTSSVVLPDIPAGLPFQITGVTSNGYWQVNLNDQIFYIEGSGLSNSNDTNTENAVTNRSLDEQAIYDKIISYKTVYPEGMRWTNDNMYVSGADEFPLECYGCAAFAYSISDGVFGINTPEVAHQDFSKLKVGDIVHCQNLTHFVIILKIDGDKVTVAEGNYNSKIHWGRVIKMDNLKKNGSIIFTRY